MRNPLFHFAGSVASVCRAGIAFLRDARSPRSSRWQRARSLAVAGMLCLGATSAHGFDYYMKLSADNGSLSPLFPATPIANTKVKLVFLPRADELPANVPMPIEGITDAEAKLKVSIGAEPF